MNRPLILITNDDGVTAPGIKATIAEARELGDVVVVAPDSPQSGMGHAVTINDTLRLKELESEPGLRVLACSGTPVDCVKLAVSVVLDRKPDLVISGINHGQNHSINVFYSGTMSAAIEAGMEGLPAIGFSLMDHSINADFTAARHFVRELAQRTLDHGLPKGTCLNVNIPKRPLSLIRGMKLSRQADAIWEEHFDERTDPKGEKYYWLKGQFVNRDPGTDTDVWALDNDYVSVVPIQFDLTGYTAMDTLKDWLA